MAEDETRQYPRIRLALFQKNLNLVMKRLFREAGHDITPEQEIILRELSERDGVNQVDLANRVGQDRNNLSRTLAILEKKGFIVRRVLPTDKRSSIVSITPAGRAFHKSAYEAINACRRILYRNFPDDDIARFSRMIEAMIDNLDDYISAESNEGGPEPVTDRRVRAAEHPASGAPSRRRGG